MLAFVVATLAHAWNTLGGGGAFDGPTLPVTLLYANGALIVVLRSFGQARDQLGSEQAEARAMRELAHRDPLTGLHNRRALEHDLAHITADQEVGKLHVLAMIDVDGLKRLNDTLGHAAGDDLLRRFGEGFAREVNVNGRAYRISGDEFALLLRGCPPERAWRVVDEVTRQVREVYAQAGASVGTAPWQSGETSSEWLSRADRAMYRHKKRTYAGEDTPETSVLPQHGAT